MLLVSKVSREKIRSVAPRPGVPDVGGADPHLLLKRRYGIEPEFRDGASRGEADANLVIGDPALKTRLNGRVVLDLAAEWRAFSGHSFVFAFWAIAPGVPEREAEAIVRRSWEAGPREFPTARRARRRPQSGLSAAVVEDYLRHSLHYELDAGRSCGARPLLPAGRGGRAGPRRPPARLRLNPCLSRDSVRPVESQRLGQEDGHLAARQGLIRAEERGSGLDIPR